MSHTTQTQPSPTQSPTPTTQAKRKRSTSPKPELFYGASYTGRSVQAYAVEANFDVWVIGRKVHGQSAGARPGLHIMHNTSRLTMSNTYLAPDVDTAKDFLVMLMATPGYNDALNALPRATLTPGKRRCFTCDHYNVGAHWSLWTQSEPVKAAYAHLKNLMALAEVQS